MATFHQSIQRVQYHSSAVQRIPTFLIARHHAKKRIHLVHLSDILSIYCKDASDNVEDLKQELYRLRASIWRFFYLDYENMIKSSSRLLCNSFEEQQQLTFYRHFLSELNRIHDFCSVKGGEIERRIAFMNDPTLLNKVTSLMDMQDAVDELVYDIQDFWHFIKLNYRASLSIVHTLDQSPLEQPSETGFLLQRLYRLVTPYSFLDLDMFMRWSFEIGKLYQHTCSTLKYYHSKIDSPIDHERSDRLTDSFIQLASPLSALPVLGIPTAPVSPPADIYNSINDSSYSSCDHFSISSAQSNNNEGDDPTPWNRGVDSISTLDKISSTLSADAQTTLQESVNHQHNDTSSTAYKFWVHPDNILELTIYLAKFMKVMHHHHASYPLATYEMESSEHLPHHGDPLTTSLIWQPITTLYLDTSDFANYTERVIQQQKQKDHYVESETCQNMEPVSSLRLRQYGDTRTCLAQITKDDYDSDHGDPHSDDNGSLAPCNMTARFYALERKQYSYQKLEPSVGSSTYSLVSSSSSSSYSSSYAAVARNSSKLVGKAPYNKQEQHGNTFSVSSFFSDTNKHKSIFSSQGTSSSSATSSSTEILVSDDCKVKLYASPGGDYNRKVTPLLSSSVYSRVWFKSKRCQPWLARRWSLLDTLAKPTSIYHYRKHGKLVEKTEDIGNKIMEMESELQAQDLQPVLRSSFNRLGFKWKHLDINNLNGVGHEIDDQQEMTVTIDTEIIITPYDKGQMMKDTFSCQDDYPCATLSPNDVNRFPYAVIQVDIPHDYHIRSIAWLDHLLSCPLLEPVQGFSLYLHGVSELVSQKVHLTPDWHKKMGMDLLRLEHQGCLSGMRRVYQQHQQHRQQNKVSGQGSASSPLSSWSSTKADLEVSSPPSNSTEIPELHVSPTSNESHFRHQPSEMASVYETTPLLPSTVNTATDSDSPAYTSYQSIIGQPSKSSDSPSSYCLSCPPTSSLIFSYGIFRVIHQLFPKLSGTTLQPTSSGTDIGSHVLSVDERPFTVIDMPYQHDSCSKARLTLYERMSPSVQYTLLIAKQPVNLTILCGVGSFIIAYILYVLVDCFSL